MNMNYMDYHLIMKTDICNLDKHGLVLNTVKPVLETTCINPFPNNKL